MKLRVFLFTIALIAVLSIAAILLRYDISTETNGSYRLDRWTGEVEFSRYSGPGGYNPLYKAFGPP